MNLIKYKLLGSLTAMVFGGAVFASGIAAAQENDDTGAEVQTRGPVHEAFAGTVSFNPEVGIIVDQPPPELVEEVPPEQRLEGDNVSWIPGYWAWDEDQGDFLWISGIWRNLPPGREWVPGYWAEIDGRHQWTSGYWEDAENTEISYLPKPPRSLEVGPNIEAPSDDQSWIPGNWVYRDDRYAWRSGYWAPSRENWSWTPAYYRWTSRGHVYVDGYWDYPVVRRGVVFAPVRFHSGYRSRPNYYYTPSTVISLSVFLNHLFIRPNYGHYYYGDYYEPRYRDRGFFASYSYNSSRYGYDPIYSHYRWENRNDRDWERGRRDYYEYRRDHQDARPPRTWAMLSARAPEDRNRDFEVAERFDRVVEKRDGRQRFQTVDKNDQERYISQRQEIRKFGKEREELETRREKSGDRDGKDRDSVSKEKIKRSPLVAAKSGRSDKDGGPPERLQPRSSDKSQKIEKSENAGKESKAGREDENKPKRDKDMADGNGNPKSKDKDATDRRVNPGEKRQADPNPERTEKSDGKREPDFDAEGKKKPGEKRQADPNPERKSNPDTNRQVDPNAEGRTKPGQKRQSSPNNEDRTKPGEKRQADPSPERQANPTPKRQADPSPERQANPTPKRQADPSPERQANPTPKRQAEPSPERQANPTPKRQAEPSPERQVNPTPKRQAEPAPKRNTNPKRELEPEREPMKANDQAAARQLQKTQSRPSEPQRAEQRVVKKAQQERQPEQRSPQVRQQEAAKQNKVKEPGERAPANNETSDTEPKKKKKQGD